MQYAKINDQLRKMLDKSIFVSAQSYFITITLSPKMYRRTTRKQFDVAVSYLHNITSSGVRVFYFPEITQKGNVHFHGVIHGNKVEIVQHLDRLKKFVNTFGFINITEKPIESDGSKQRVIDYLIKEVQETRKILHICFTKMFIYSIINDKTYDEDDKIYIQRDMNGLDEILIEEQTHLNPSA